MPSNQTPNYQLSQWERTDKILMDDFNGDNAKIDGALKAEADARSTATAELSAALAQKGNCQVVYMTYRGDGTYGPNHPNTLTFEHKPLLVFICGDRHYMAYFLRGWVNTMPVHKTGGGFYIKWGENSVSWYAPVDDDDQFNRENNTYHVVAFLAAD